MRQFIQPKRGAEEELDVEISKSKKAGDHLTNLDLKNLEMILWSKITEPSMNLLSYDAINPNYEIQMVDLSAELNQHRDSPIKPVDNFPNKIFMVTNSKDETISLNIISTIELYGRYASKQLKIKYPVFNYMDYINSNITFYAFLITTLNPGILGILLFDNYETKNINTFSLRLEWWFPSKFIQDDANKNQISRCVIRILDLDEEELKVTSATYIRPFNNSPIKATFDDCIVESFWKNKEVKLQQLIGDIEKERKIIDEKIKKCTSIDHLKQEFPLFNPEMRYSYQNIVPSWNTVVRLQIQVPLLNASDWQQLAKVQTSNGMNPLGQNFICVIAQGIIPEYVKDLARRYSMYLKREERYDFPLYDNSEENQHEIYCILNTDFKYCIGLFIFKGNQNISNFIEELKSKYESVTSKVDKSDIKAWSDAKFRNNKHKLEDSRQKYYKENPDLETLPSYMRPRNTPYQKYENKAIKYKYVNFFAHAKDNLPKDFEDSKILTVAWIHPLHRKQGLLKKVWPVFCLRYGMFSIDKPSNAMKSFINKSDIQQRNFANKYVV